MNSISSAKEITRVKSQKVFAEVIDIIENGDITSTLEFVAQKIEEGEYTAEQLAAGFMKLKMGADIEDLVLFEKSDRPRREGGRGDRRFDRRSDRRFDRSRRDGERFGRRDKDGKGEKSDRRGKGSRSERDDRRFDKKSRDGRFSKRRSDNDSSEFPVMRRKKPSEKPVSNASGLDEALIESIKKDRNTSAKNNSSNSSSKKDRNRSSRKSDGFENVGRINIKGEGSTKAWYMGAEDTDTMHVSKSDKKKIKSENKKRSLDYLQDVSDLVMESFGKRKNKGE